MHHGRKWKVPVIDGMGYGTAYGIETEPWIYDAIAKIHSQSRLQIFLDIGANTGQSLIKVKSIDPQIHYYGFEPNPSCVFYLDYLRRVNKLTNVNLICGALGDNHDLLELSYEGLDDTRATLLDTFKSFSQTVYKRKVPVFPLDHVEFEFDPHSNILIKIDVEGFELEVLQGAERFLKSARPKLIFEVLPHHDDKKVLDKQKRLFELLQANDYVIFSLNEQKKPGIISLGFNNKDDYSRCDYQAIPFTDPVMIQPDDE